MNDDHVLKGAIYGIEFDAVLNTENPLLLKQ